ncbi:hypothetical protein I4U23_012609 [Adineta vaga]|nr:hypothetical protein I4U23_012609 [Adineta vaga]
MSSQIVPIHRSNQPGSSTDNKNDIWFNAFNHAPGDDASIRWLSRPNQQLFKDKYGHDTEKFRITFDVENFKPEQIKIYIQNHKLTISGVYEERSEGRFMQKQFERTFDIPSNAAVDSMASFITAAHMLVVEIPLTSSTQVDQLSINQNANNQRRLSFSLNKYNTSNDNNALTSTSNDVTNLAAPGQQVRRTSVTKTMTTTTTTGSSELSPEATELLRSADTTTGNTSQTYSTHRTERRSSTTGNQQQITHNEPNSSTTTKQSTLTSSELSDLPIEIPPELLASGGTITIQKRKVSITKSTDGHNDTPIPASHNTETHSTLTKTSNSTHNTDQSVSVPIQRNNEHNETRSSTTSTTTSAQNTDQSVSAPNKRTDESHLTTSNQNQTSTSERRGSKTISSSNHSALYTLEEFLQNKTWNPSLVDGPDGKKTLYMRLQMKPGTTLDQMKISLNGYDLRVDVNNKVSADGGQYMSEHSYRQVTLFPTCEIDHLKTELKDDGFLHIQVPIKL